MEYDRKQIVESMIQVLQNTLQSSGKGKDQNLADAIHILQNFELCVRIAPPPIETNGQEYPILGIWNEVVDSTITAHAQPTGLHKGTLFVSVDSAAWLDEIVRYRRKEILGQLQQRLGGDLVARVSFRIGVSFAFYLPPKVLAYSEQPHQPGVLFPANPPSAQMCIRLALEHVLKHNNFQLSFREDKSFAEQPLSNQCTILGFPSAAQKEYRGMKFQSGAEIRICQALEDLGLASKERTRKLGHWVSCFGVRSQRASGNLERCESADDCRRIRCNRRSRFERGRA